MDDDEQVGQNPPQSDAGPPPVAQSIPLGQGQMSYQEAMAHLNAERDAMRQQATPADTSGGPGTPPAPSPSPVQGFWDKLLHGVKGESRTLETLRSVGRGAVNLVNSAYDTAHKLEDVTMRRGLEGMGLPTDGVPPERTRDLTDLVTGNPGEPAHYSIISPKLEDRLLGKRSDDPLAAFTEDATSFYLGWEAAGLLKIGTAGQTLKELSSGEHVGKLVRAGATALHGAIVDFAAFDPHQAGLAELAAKAPVPILKPLGEFLSVDQDDGPIVARLKRAAAGILPAGVMDGLVASGRVLKGVKVLRSATATPAEKEAAHALVAENAQIVQDVANGTHIAEGQHLVPVEDGNGGYTVAVNPASPLKDKLVGADAPVEAATETKPAVVAMPDAPHFADLAEAQTQTEVLNHALDAHTSPNVQGKLTDEQMQQLSDVWHRLLSGEDPADVQKMLEGTHFNFSYAFPDIEKAKALIESMSEVFRAPLDEAQHVAGVPVAETIAQARQMLGSLSPEAASIALTNSLRQGGTEALSARTLAGDILLKDLGQQLGDRYFALSARPFDEVAHEQARFGLESYFRLQEALAGSNSEIGRSLRILRERNNPLIRAPMEEVDAAVAKARTQAAEDAQDAIASAKKEVQRAEKRAAKATNGNGAKPNPADTIGPNANDFILNRARKRVENALKRLAAIDPEFEHNPELAAQRGQEIVSGAQAQRENPLTLSPEDQAALKEKAAAQPRNPIDELSKLIEQSEAQVDAAVERARTPRAPREPQTTPFDAAKAEARRQAAEEPNPLRKEKPQPEPLAVEQSSGGNTLDGVTGSATSDATALGKSTRRKSGGILTSAEDIPQAYTAGMSHRDIQDLTRMLALGGGDLRNAEALVQGLQAVKPVGLARKLGLGAMEVFINGLLSAFTTPLTALVSNIGVTANETIGKLAAGVVTGNRTLLREGADITWGNFRYIGDAIQMARAAFREGRSILDPHPMYEVIPKQFGGSIVRAPTRFLVAGDEFVRQLNYRSFVRAKALRMGRQLGMEGEALQRYAENAVKNSIDPQYGIGLVGKALDYAEVPTLSGPLRSDSFGAAFRRFTNDRQELKLIVPFIRASAHIFNYVSMRTPLLNIFNKQAREIMRAGGEEAAVLHTQSAMAGMLYAGGMYEAMRGNLTGRGPSDPELRRLWLQNHQPYSIRVGDHWVSYLRGDPLALPLGLIADTHTIWKEANNGEASAPDLATAVVASLAANLANKSYLRGLTQFMAAWGSGDTHEVTSWLRNFVGNAAVPQAVNKANPDPYFREVRGYADAVMARIPGFSEHLDPYFNVFGEPEMKSTGPIQTSLNPFPVRSVGSSVEDDLLALGHGLSSPPETLANGQIDLTDKRWDSRGVGKSPWRRFNELVRNPKYGKPLREQMEDLVKSDRWKRASVGTEMVPGGERWLLATAVQQAAYSRAKAELFNEYPNLRQAVREAAEIQAANLTQSDGTKVQEIREKYSQLGLPPLKK